MKDLMKKYVLEFGVIFLGVLISFGIQRQSDDRKEKEEILKSITTLRQEISTNINYCKEHLVQLENMAVVNDSILIHYETFTKTDLMRWHNARPFGHSYLSNGELRYWTTAADYENLYFWMITWWNTFSQNQVYFDSLVNSGLLLYIEDHVLREEIESIYETKKKRVTVNESLLKGVSDKIFTWQEVKRNKAKSSVSRETIFTFQKDLQLKNLLEDRQFRIQLRIMSLENYIAALELVQTKLAALE